MRRRRRTVRGALVLPLVAALLGAGAGTAEAEPSPPASPPVAPSASLPAAERSAAGEPLAGKAAVRTLTLVTGDTVTSSGGRIAVRPREGVQFLRYRDGEHRYVVPSDAVPLLRADRLDRRLFDVNGLLAGGYDRLPALPLIVSDTSGASAARGLRVGRRLAAIDGFAAEIPARDLAGNWPALRTSLTTGKIWLDGMRVPTLDVSVPRTGAPAAWARGLDGTGVKVAVLDSGIDDTHPDLAGKVAGRRNFVPDFEGDDDLNGHGTHVASTLAGTGAATGGRYRGVAPGATLLDGKVCFDYGGDGLCPESSILEGMQWAVASGAKVVNLSLGAPDGPGVDPLETAVDELTARYDALFVIAAGNQGAARTIGSPASADAALAVGAVTKTGEVDSYSSRGPRLGDHGVKPEITAPGTDIVAARSGHTADGEPGDAYISHSGTSMATPHVAGGAAILTQAHPEWTAERRKAVLVGSARAHAGYDVFTQGAGELDLVRALDQPVSASPATVAFGLRESPGQDGALARRLTYRNAGGAPVTLALALTTAAPAGTFTLGATSLTVPAGGEASVELRAETGAAGGGYDVFSGRVVATAPEVSVQTPFSVFRERPSADVTVTSLDRTGAPAMNAITMVAGPANGLVFYAMGAESTFRVPLGTYFAATLMPGDDGTSTVVVHPDLAVTGKLDLVLDGGKARNLDITVPGGSAAPVSATVETLHSGGVLLAGAGVSGDPAKLYTADLGTGKVAGLTTYVTALFAEPEPEGKGKGKGKGGDGGSPATYQTGWYHTGSFTTGFTRHVGRRDLATVSAGYAANVKGAEAWRTNYPVVPGIEYPAGSQLPPVASPRTRTEYYAGNLAWEPSVDESAGATETGGFPTRLTQLNGRATRYAAGREYTERWNGAVLGLPMTANHPEYPIVERRGDELLLRLDGYADAEGHHGFTEAGDEDRRIAVHRDGELVVEEAGAFKAFDLDPTPGRYRLEYTVKQPFARLSTRFDTVWEFDSAHTAKGTALPLTAIGFAPGLDLANTARAGRLTAIPITFTRQATAGKVRDVEVDVSFDDGATWRGAPVARVLGRWGTVVAHPSRPGHVSLRGRAVDTAGNRVTVTVIRAYETR